VVHLYIRIRPAHKSLVGRQAALSFAQDYSSVYIHTYILHTVCICIYIYIYVHTYINTYILYYTYTSIHTYAAYTLRILVRRAAESSLAIAPFSLLLYMYTHTRIHLTSTGTPGCGKFCGYRSLLTCILIHTHTHYQYWDVRLRKALRMAIAPFSLTTTSNPNLLVSCQLLPLQHACGLESVGGRSRLRWHLNSVLRVMFLYVCMHVCNPSPAKALETQMECK
jgi:hypothetical protein